MNLPKLKDVEAWTSVNENFSFFDYIQAQVQEKVLSPDLFITFLKLIFPDFILVEGSVFLAAEFKREKYIEYKNDRMEKKKIEYWMNLVSLDGFFSNTYDDEQMYLEHCEYLGKEISKSWRLKLQSEFPDKEFEIKSFTDHDEVYIVFTEKE